MEAQVDVVAGGTVEQPVDWPLLHDVDSGSVSGEHVIPGVVQLDVDAVTGGVTQIVGAQVVVVIVPVVVDEQVVPGELQVGL